jgi:hypothetical protein
VTADSSRDKLDELAADFEAGFDLPVIPAPPTPAAKPTAPGEGLKGLLTRRPTPPAPTTPDPDRPAAHPAPEAITPPAQPASTRTRVAVSSEDSTGGLRPTSFSVPATLIDRLATFKAAHGGLTTADVLLDALEATEADLPAALGPAPSEGRFARAPQRARRRADQGRLGQLHVRLVASNYAILDDLVAKSGASSRSHLVTTALTLYLDKNSARP